MRTMMNTRYGKRNMKYRGFSSYFIIKTIFSFLSLSFSLFTSLSLILRLSYSLIIVLQTKLCDSSYFSYVIEVKSPNLVMIIYIYFLFPGLWLREREWRIHTLTMILGTKIWRFFFYFWAIAVRSPVSIMIIFFFFQVQCWRWGDAYAPWLWIAVPDLTEKRNE